MLGVNVQAYVMADEEQATKARISVFILTRDDAKVNLSEGTSIAPFVTARIGNTGVACTGSGGVVDASINAFCLIRDDSKVNLKEGKDPSYITVTTKAGLLCNGAGNSVGVAANLYILVEMNESSYTPKRYIGVNGIARRVLKKYVGVDGVARLVTKQYVGVNGVARKLVSE